MLLSVLLLSKLSSTVCSLSLKTPSFFPHTLSLSFSQSRLPLLSHPPFFCLSPSTSLFFHILLLCFFFSYSLTSRAVHLLLFFSLSASFFLLHSCLPLPPSLNLFFSSSLSPSPALQELGIAVSRLAQRTGRHMGGLFCNPAGHTTLAQERGGGWWDVGRERRGREDWAGLYYYLPTYTFAASLCLRADGLSLFSHRWQEVSPRYIVCACWGFRS